MTPSDGRPLAQRLDNAAAERHNHLARHGAYWRFVRRVPREYAHLDPRRFVQHSTKLRIADDPNGKRAKLVASQLNAALERHWRDLAEGKPSNYEAEKSAARSSKRPKRPSFVYFIECGDYIKIGYATSVRSRLSNLAIATPFPLKVLATIDGDKHTESTLHTRFADAFHKGEWFRRTPELLAFIDQINNVGMAA